MRTMHRFLLLSLTTGVVLVACGRTPLSVEVASSGDGGAGASSSVTATSTTTSVTTSVSVSVSASVSVSSTTGTGGGPACTPEICDGLDNNCDGIIDEGCQCAPGSIAPCYSGPAGTIGVGVCKQGQHTCDAKGLGFGPCMGEVTPSAEICNGLDDNCNNDLGDDGCVLGACSDGTREGFLDAVKYPKIAGCSGGFSVSGLVGVLAPTCAFSAGNSGNNPGGVGCSAADLCSPGFHVCKSAADVQASSPTGCVGAASSGGLFFATGQSSTGCNLCALGVGLDPVACDDCSCGKNCQQTVLVDNDLFGCGSIGDAVGTCGGLDRSSGNLCGSIGGSWNCSSPGGLGCDEASHVTKSASVGGGVLCCAD